MTTKTPKYYGLIVLLAVSLSAGFIYSTQSVDAGKTEGLTIGDNNLVEKAKADGSAYIKSVPVPHTESLQKGVSNTIPVEVTLVSENDNTSWVTLKPVVRGQYTTLNQETQPFTDAQIKNAVESGVMLDGMFDKSKFVSFNVDTITLKANVPNKFW